MGSFPFDRHYSGNRSFLSFPPGTKMFQFPGLAPSIMMVHGLHPCGLTHSDIPGSKPVCGSPGLFAAYHVLRRLQKPRHPPFALVTFNFLQKLKIASSFQPPSLRDTPFQGESGTCPEDRTRAAALLRLFRKSLADARRDA